MKTILCLTAVLAALTLSLPSLRAADTPAATPAATEPLLTINLPANLKAEDVTAAVAKAFTARGWAEVNTAGSSVTASLNKNGISIKATAATSAAEVKLFAEIDGGGKIDAAKAKKETHRWLKYIELSTKETLGLSPSKADKTNKDKKAE
jgi:hypothetical protein